MASRIFENSWTWTYYGFAQINKINEQLIY